jgi:small subunit ribosomal protein S16
MLAIRMQRTGRSGHAQYRVIVQDSRFTPTSGRVVAYLGSYNPHTKEATIDGEKTSGYLTNGAQPSPRVVRLLSAQGIKLPDWVKEPAKKERSIRNVEKLRRNRPAEAVSKTPVAETSSADEAPAPEVVAETEEPEVKTSGSSAQETTAEEAITEETEVPSQEAEVSETDKPAEPKAEKLAEPASEPETPAAELAKDK